jgi:hypothetical protein
VRLLGTLLAWSLVAQVLSGCWLFEKEESIRNTPPSAIPLTEFQLDEDSPGYSIDLKTLGTDLEGDLLTFVINFQVQHGNLTDAVDGVVTYTPLENFNGEDGFTFVASDGQSFSDPGVVRLIVFPVNDPPEAFDDFVVTGEDTPIVIDVLGNDVDVEGDNFEIDPIIGEPDHGFADLVNGFIVYDPEPNYSGPDQFVYRCMDASEVGNLATVFITVTEENDPPFAMGDGAATVNGVPVNIFPLANDFDMEMDPLTIISFTQPGVGGGSVQPGPCSSSLVYTPPSDCAGDSTVEFTYIVSDGILGAEAMVTVDILCTEVTFSGSDQAMNYDAATGLALVTVPLFVNETSQVSHEATMATIELLHDPGLLEVVDVRPGPALPSTVSLTWDPLSDRVRIAVSSAQGFPLDGDQAILEVDYSTRSGGLVGQPGSVSTQLTWGSQTRVTVSTSNSSTLVAAPGGDVALQFSASAASLEPVVYYAPGQTVPIGAGGSATFDESLYIKAVDTSGAPLNVQGISVSMAHDPTLNAQQVVEGSALSAVNSGQGADFFEFQIFPLEGFYVGAVMSMDLTSTLNAGTPAEMIRVTFEAGPVPITQVTYSQLFWFPLSNPSVGNIVSSEPAISHEPQLLSGQICLVPPAPATPTAEDCNTPGDQDGDGYSDCDDPDCL